MGLSVAAVAADAANQQSMEDELAAHGLTTEFWSTTSNLGGWKYVLSCCIEPNDWEEDVPGYSCFVVAHAEKVKSWCGNLQNLIKVDDGFKSALTYFSICSKWNASLLFCN